MGCFSRQGEVFQGSPARIVRAAPPRAIRQCPKTESLFLRAKGKRAADFTARRSASARNKFAQKLVISNHSSERTGLFARLFQLVFANHVFTISWSTWYVNPFLQKDVRFSVSCRSAAFPRPIPAAGAYGMPAGQAWGHPLFCPGVPPRHGAQSPPRFFCSFRYLSGESKAPPSQYVYRCPNRFPYLPL